MTLHLRGEVRQVFTDWLRANRPDLVPRYEELYRRGAYAPRKERERLAKLVRGGDTAHGFGAGTRRWRGEHGGSTDEDENEDLMPGAVEARPSRPAQARQASLF